MNNELLSEAASRLFGSSLVVPHMAYGNLLLPGQELGLHTDVPAFRGGDRNVLPLWLLVVMRHSGLFERWRIPIATAVAFVGECEGGEFAYYPDGRTGPSVQVKPASGSVIVLDADTVFHGVDRVIGDGTPLFSTRWAIPESIEHRESKVGARRVPARSGCGVRSLEVPIRERRHSILGFLEGVLLQRRTPKVGLGHSQRRPSCRNRHGFAVERIVERGALPKADQGLSDTDLALLMIDTFIQFPDVTTSL